MQQFPATQHAVLFTGRGRIEIDGAKQVDPVGPTQMLLQIEACGICFSDTKLLHAFDAHPRKAAVVGGLDEDALLGNPSYHPGDEPVTPGHEPVGRIVEVGDDVRNFAVGDRVLVQADWKHIRTANSNAAFGYNFDGGLQEYVVVDERCVVTPEGEEFLIHVGKDTSAAAVALIEPWATVEASYASRERGHVAPGGRLLVLGDGQVDTLLREHEPAEVVRAAQFDVVEGDFDDIVYFGSDAATIETLLDMLRLSGVLCLVLDGATIDRQVSVDIGRIHYDFIRICGTTGSDPADGYRWIPETGEVRDGDHVVVAGAAGPMGTMHTLRNVLLDRAGLTVTATGRNDERLARLRALIEKEATGSTAEVRYVNTDREPLAPGPTYVACMVPVPAFVADLIVRAGEGAIVNAYAGIPVGHPHPVDLQHVIEQRIFVFGTSGSDVSDMRTVLRKVEGGAINPLVSLDAISGIAGFEDAIAAVTNRTSGGKIMVFPQLPDLPYLRLEELGERLPHVAELLDGGVWTKEAEDALLGR